MNEIAVRFGGSAVGTGLMNRADLQRSLNNASVAAPTVGGDKAYLKMDKGGIFVYGQEEVEVEEGSEWAVNPLSLAYGFVSWGKVPGAPEGEVMVPVSRDLPNKETLRTNAPGGVTTGEHGWQFQQSVDLMCVSGTDKGVAVQYKQSSVGSQKLFKTLIDQIMSRVEAGEDSIVPVIVMKSSSYKHKQFGKVHNPIFEVIEWVTMNGEAADDDEPAVEEPKPVTRTRAAAPQPEIEQPAARTRTRAAAQPEPEPEQDDDGQAPEMTEEEEAALAAEYAAEQAAQAEAPRRRVRR